MGVIGSSQVDQLSDELCLPLPITSAHGWVVITVRGFTPSTAVFTVWKDGKQIECPDGSLRRVSYSVWKLNGTVYACWQWRLSRAFLAFRSFLAEAKRFV